VKNSHLSLSGPASSANLGSGFDCFAIAIEGISDKITLSVSDSTEIEIDVLGVGDDKISTKLEENTGGLVAKNMFTENRIDGGIKIEIEKGVPPGKGLGSSAATASAVAFGINEIYQLGLSSSQLLSFAASGEIASAGVPHADNVAGSIFGGFTVVHYSSNYSIQTFSPPENLRICLAIPDIETPDKKTGKARGVIPEQIPFGDVVKNIANASMMVAGFAKQDMSLIGVAMNDHIVEPARSQLVPLYHELRKLAVDMGTLGIAISGAGPSMIVFIDERKSNSNEIQKLIEETYTGNGLGVSTKLTTIGEGVSIL
jgi:homoserine kinase|tara:strand:- start:190 stop:1131 length:942 start_codon:yes stop_codon:yes gene_type:complete